MSQRNSEYGRVRNDAYYTPAWVTRTLFPYLPKRLSYAWEPSAGNDKMSNVLIERFPQVAATDLDHGVDFLTIPSFDGDCVITNPPYDQAQAFIEHALELTQPKLGVVAMLLRVDYDTARTRRHLFADSRIFACKLTLTKRIRWFEGTTGSPSENHAWFVWDWRHSGPAILAYDKEGDHGPRATKRSLSGSATRPRPIQVQLRAQQT
jgi:hypothetical protein